MDYKRLLINKGKPYLKGEDVRAVQNALVNGGFSVGKHGVDGIYGQDTEKAVKAYQKTYGLKVDGIVGSITWGHLFREQNTDDDLLRAQKLLNVFGYDAGTENAIYGEKTKAAVKKFQKAMGITVDGKLGAETWAALNHMEARFNAWGFGIEKRSVRMFQAAVGISPDGVAGKNTKAKLDGTPILPQDSFDFTCQCRATGKNYCNGLNGLTEAEVKKRLWAVRILHERIIRELEKTYPNVRGAIFLTTAATPSPTGGIAGGIRCPKWNKARSGSTSSKHMGAYAMDLNSKNTTYRKAYGKLALSMSKYNGAHVYSSGAVHIDINDKPKKRRWK